MPTALRPQRQGSHRLASAELQPMLLRLTERLYDTINRGPVLRCFATKGFRTRMDAVRLNGSVRASTTQAHPDFARALVEALVRRESASIEIQLDIGANDPEKRQRALALYYALTQGIVRGADAIYRETGLRSLWLAYRHR